MINRKKIIKLGIILIFVLLILSVIPRSVADINNLDIYSTKEHTEKSNQNSKWTWMSYDDVDFYQSYDPLNDFADEVFSQKNLDVLVLQEPND
jgi:hypothetical protein